MSFWFLILKQNEAEYRLAKIKIIENYTITSQKIKYFIYRTESDDYNYAHDIINIKWQTYSARV
jgi:hypothetical protein